MGNTKALQVFYDHKKKLIRERDSNGATLLHYAAANEQKATVEWLMEKKSDSRVPDDRQHLPKHYAALAGSQELARTLSPLGVCIVTMDSSGL